MSVGIPAPRAVEKSRRRCREAPPRSEGRLCRPRGWPKAAKAKASMQEGSPWPPDLRPLPEGRTIVDHAVGPCMLVPSSQSRPRIEGEAFQLAGFELSERAQCPGHIREQV